MNNVVVIGGGIAGASVAFGLARRGAHVTLIDDGRAGRATAAGAGIVAPWGSSLDGDLYALYAAGAEAYPATLAALGEAGVAEPAYAQTGALFIADTDEGVAELASRLRPRVAGSAVAGELRQVDSDECRALFPVLASGWRGWFVPGGARVGGRRLVNELIAGVATYGGSVITGRAAFDGATVSVGGSPIHADAVVIASGAWAATAELTIATPVPVAPQRGQICHFELDGVDTSTWPCVAPVGDHYFCPFEDGRVIAGATREPDAGFDPRLTAGGIAEVVENALRVAPGLASATLFETRVGLRPYPTHEHRPCIGRVSANTWLVTGFGAIGLTVGHMVGDRVAAAVLNRDAPIDPLIAGFAP